MLSTNKDPCDVWDGRKNYVPKIFDGIDQGHQLIEYQCDNGFFCIFENDALFETNFRWMCTIAE